MKSKRKPVRNPKPRNTGTAPVVNRRVANKPFKPARGRFVERVGMDGPEDVTAFDAAPYVEQLDTGDEE